MIDRITGLALELKTDVYQTLLTSSGVALTPLDIAIRPYSNLIYIVDKDTLYIYNDAIKLPSRKLLDKVVSTPDRLSVIEPTVKWAKYGEQLKLNLYFARPINAITKHKLLVKYPSALVSGINDGTLYTPTDTKVWVTGDPKNRKLRPTETVKLDQFGEYLFTLETHYKDNTIDYDQVVVSVPTKKPLAEMTVHHFLPTGTTVSGIDFDVLTGKLRLLATNKTRYLLDEHKDLMLVDFTNKQLYFHENYDSVRVIK